MLVAEQKVTRNNNPKIKPFLVVIVANTSYRIQPCIKPFYFVSRIIWEPTDREVQMWTYLGSSENNSGWQVQKVASAQIRAILQALFRQNARKLGKLAFCDWTDPNDKRHQISWYRGNLIHYITRKHAYYLIQLQRLTCLLLSLAVLPKTRLQSHHYVSSKGEGPRSAKSPGAWDLAWGARRKQRRKGCSYIFYQSYLLMYYVFGL